MSEKPCKPKRKNPIGIADLIIYRAGIPPGSGLVSKTANELLTNEIDSQKATAQNGSSSNAVPIKLTQAFPFSEKR